MSNDSIFKTVLVAFGVCVVCSVVVSTAAVYLKPLQERNKTLDMKKNILAAAGIIAADDRPDADTIESRFDGEIETRLIDLASGTYVEDDSLDAVTFDQRKAAKDPNLGMRIAPEKDVAGVRDVSKYRLVYLKMDDDQIERVILPVHGKGLWSTMYGFLALNEDLRQIESFSFYEHGETPGLGGEVDNSKWKKQWIGKQPFDSEWQPVMQVVKGGISSDPGKAIHQVEGLSGATITARGVEKLVQFWLSEDGYGPYLQKLREGGSNE
jgi:Na+-transporting NADH:ubiquinone oxidoreductase subunit C